MQGIPRSRFGLLSEPPTLILKLDAAVDSELLTWAAAGCLARSVFVGVTQRVAQLVGGSRVNLMSGK